MKSKKQNNLNYLYTRWGRNLDKSCPLPEYPRPQLKRDNWECLNGIWEYAITAASNKNAPENYDGNILVPFSPESLLSGVNRQLLPGEKLWYKRKVEFKPAQKDQRILLHFGAVDQHCTVHINGFEAGSHSGGYWPFYFDVTEHIAAGVNELIVCVTDDSDTGDEAYGKQRLKRGGIWYTAQSGIWQTVWYEAVPLNHLKDVKITPNLKKSQVEFEFQWSSGTGEKGEIQIFEGEKLKAKHQFTEHTANVKMKDFILWTPDNPFLYNVKVIAGEDIVQCYFAMREFNIAYDTAGYPRISLNGEEIFQTGLLDQGYWSDGMYTPPSDEAIVWEISELKQMGFNMLRKHIKIEPMRWYYHCDRLGMIVWQDFVNGGNDYNPMVTMVLPFIGIKLKDGRYKTFGRESKNGRNVFERDMGRTINLLYNCPCIAVWVPFNEGWGQFDACRITKQINKLDSTRFIDHASGWHDQGCGDFCSKHIYYRKYKLKNDKYSRVQALTEFGGYSCPEEGHMSSDKLFGYKMYNTKGELTEAFVNLYEREVIPAVEMGLSACIYTQVSDVEDEINGIFTYDRETIKMDKEKIKAVNVKLLE